MQSLVTPAAIFAVVVRPQLWGTALRQLFRLAPQGWWKRAPFLPVPPADYLEFRLVTQYGGEHGSQREKVRTVDVLDYLAWCKEWNQARS
ncbi:unannotated protein [freshwater metagenome]|jgi:hypothetical protein|uniref:Unannotated protein n=1 Tax=freshwater metagenome TaxID=449393 RepID=A0A6J6HE28_9ZZZZ|nr:hypothetical protein [Actinomycetota bacterium]